MKRLSKVSLGVASTGFILYIYSLLQSTTTKQMDMQLLLLGTTLFVVGALLFVYNFLRVAKGTK